MRRVLILAAMFLPRAWKPMWYRRLLGWTVGRNVRIGFSYLDAGEATLGDDVVIGHFNLMRNVARLNLGDRVRIGNFNSFAGAIESGSGWSKTLTLGEGCYVTSKHYFDVAGELTIGAATVVAGRDSQFWTHTLIIEHDTPQLVPRNLAIGDDCRIGARSTLVFCELPRKCLVGAGSVVVGRFEEDDRWRLIAGNPAEVRKHYELEPTSR